MPIIIAPESINELTLICVLIQYCLMRSGQWRSQGWPIARVQSGLLQAKYENL